MIVGQKIIQLSDLSDSEVSSEDVMQREKPFGVDGKVTVSTKTPNTDLVEKNCTNMKSFQNQRMMDQNLDKIEAAKFVNPVANPRKYFSNNNSTDESEVECSLVETSNKSQGQDTFKKFTQIDLGYGHYKGETIVSKGKEIPHGHGELLYKNNIKYIGEWFDGKRHGHGLSTSPNDDLYKGQWENDVISGHGIYIKTIIEDGRTFKSTYIGEFLNSKRHGKGKWIKDRSDPSSNQYEGVYQNDK